MAGIVFFKTYQINDLERFYTEELGMEVWLRQADCIILRHENLLLGFCARAEVERSGIITFVYRTRKEVDALHARLGDVASAPPAVNDKYNIYHFFGSDPEHRLLEFQCFLHPVEI
ncbi:MAG: VOC family protein [candidate division WOR-3 bacterium]|nr:MAG: VOC family protein [candidate division WOR-3 bacterium]